MDKTIELVNSVKDIQAMPSVIVKVLNVMKKPTVSMKELGDLVVYDQSLTIKILALVNSAYYGFSQQISSINIALSLLGMVKVKNIINYISTLEKPRATVLLQIILLSSVIIAVIALIYRYRTYRSLICFPRRARKRKYIHFITVFATSSPRWDFKENQSYTNLCFWKRTVEKNVHYTCIIWL